MPDDYVFASETMRGKQPYWPDNLMKRHIRPVARANGIHKNIGWHTFRHTFGTLLKANGEDVKTVQELLLIRMMVPGVGQTEIETDPQIVQRGA